tara:strand:- start:137 stop:298 length:162 start_codon:yes stop_codon:yes gene_type:complete
MVLEVEVVQQPLAPMQPLHKQVQVVQEQQVQLMAHPQLEQVVVAVVHKDPLHK